MRLGDEIAGPWKPGMTTIGQHRVRVRRNWTCSTPPWTWDLMDGHAVVASFASAPSASDLDAALARHRSGVTREQLVDAAAARAAEDARRIHGRLHRDW